MVWYSRFLPNLPTRLGACINQVGLHLNSTYPSDSRTRHNTYSMLSPLLLRSNT